jgi:hypothetical protein
MVTLTIADVPEAAAPSALARLAGGLIRRVSRLWSALVESYGEMDPMAAQMLTATRIWHVPPSPAELESIARMMSSSGGRIREP